MLAGALIDSLFQTSAHSAAALDSRIYGTRTVSNRLLDQAVKNNHYLVLLSSSGAVLAHSKGFNAVARSDLADSAALKLFAPAGHGRWAMCSPIPHGGVLNYGLTVPTGYGTRYLLTGFGPSALGPLLARRIARDPRREGFP